MESSISDVRFRSSEQPTGNDDETLICTDSHTGWQPVAVRAGGITTDHRYVSVVQFPDLRAVLGSAAVSHLGRRLAQPPMESRGVIGFPWPGHDVTHFQSIASTRSFSPLQRADKACPRCPIGAELSATSGRTAEILLRTLAISALRRLQALPIMKPLATHFRGYAFQSGARTALSSLGQSRGGTGGGKGGPSHGDWGRRGAVGDAGQ